jgi:hypothetical protein
MGDRRSGQQLLDDFAADSQLSILDQAPSVFDTLLDRIIEKCKALDLEIGGTSHNGPGVEAPARQSRPAPPLAELTPSLQWPEIIHQQSLAPLLSFYALGLTTRDVSAVLGQLPPTLSALAHRALLAFSPARARLRHGLCSYSNGPRMYAARERSGGEDPAGRLAMWEAQEEVLAPLHAAWFL